MRLADLVFPTRCAGCGTLGPSPCHGCVQRLQVGGERHIPGLQRCVVLVEYDDVSRRLVASLKYRGVRATLPWFATGLAERIVAAGEEPHLVTWVPATPGHRRRRGFDQGQLLAEAVAGRLGVPSRRLLRRRGSSPQTGHDRAERLRGPVLVPVPGADVAHADGTRILIVDDVITTGSSLRVAATQLGPAPRLVGAAVAQVR